MVNEKLKYKIHKRLEDTFDLTIDHPVIKAQSTWSIVSDQLLDVLGPEVHSQWFKKAKPLILKNNILVIQVEGQFAARWISTHYQQLIDLLISLQNDKLSCFFVAKK